MSKKSRLSEAGAIKAIKDIYNYMGRFGKEVKMAALEQGVVFFDQTAEPIVVRIRPMKTLKSKF